MPLDRQHVTVASRVMLPVDVAFGGVLGLIWALQDPSRRNQSLAALDRTWPVENTGWVLVAVAGVILAALLGRNRTLAMFGCAAGVVAYFVLTIIFAGPLDLDLQLGWPPVTVGPSVSLSAPLWPAYLAAAHLASLASLAVDEYTDRTGNHRP